MQQLKRLLVGLIAIYVFVCASLYLMQDGLIFHPRPNDAASVAALSRYAWRLEHGAATLNGWFVPGPSANLPLVVYFGGNAQDVSVRAAEVAASPDRAAGYLIVNYRGYGSSSGTPGQDEFFADALEVFDAAHASLPHNGKIVAWGRSLGSGVAVHLAAARPLAGVILITPFDSITAVAQDYYGFLPARWLLSHPFDSASRAPRIDVPALIMIAGNDRIIPPAHAERLASLWAGPTEVHRFVGASHDAVQRDPAFYRLIDAFLRTL